MKANIHPVWYKDTKVICACGNTFTTGSTVPQIKIEICAKCHPIFTGQQKLVDTLGQVDRFTKKVEVAQIKKEEIRKRTELKQSKIAEKKKDKPTLRELLIQARKQVAS